MVDSGSMLGSGLAREGCGKAIGDFGSGEKVPLAVVNNEVAIASEQFRR